MGRIRKQLVTDEEGHSVEVLIPHEEWLRIEQQLGGAAAANGIEHLRRPEGMICLSEDPVAYQRRLRDEWPCQLTSLFGPPRLHELCKEIGLGQGIARANSADRRRCN